MITWFSEAVVLGDTPFPLDECVFNEDEDLYASCLLANNAIKKVLKNNGNNDNSVVECL